MQAETQAELPDQIAHGFLKAGRLHALDLGHVRCYQWEEFHTGFTLFRPDGAAPVFVQMYRLPEGEKSLKEHLVLQMEEKKWGKLPKEDFLQLKIFPTNWTHVAYLLNPNRIVHLYRGPNRAVFIRYLAKSLQDSLFIDFNEHLHYLPEMWHTDLVARDLVAAADPSMAPAPTVDAVDAVDLRVEQAAVRKMILEGLKQFASDQREPGGDVHDLPVTGIIVWFDVGNGSLSVHLDVRAPFEVDGSYSHQEFMALLRENWRQFVEHLYDGHAVTLTGLDGKAVKIAPESDFDVDERIGLMILDLLNLMRREKAFAPLLLAPGAELIIEAEDAAFAWPSRFEVRGKDNLI